MHSRADGCGHTHSDGPAEYLWRESPQSGAGFRCSRIIYSTYGGLGAAHGLPERLDAEGAGGVRARSPSDGGDATARARLSSGGVAAGERAC